MLIYVLRRFDWDQGVFLEFMDAFNAAKEYLSQFRAVHEVRIVETSFNRVMSFSERVKQTQWVVRLDTTFEELVAGSSSPRDIDKRRYPEHVVKVIEGLVNLDPPLVDLVSDVLVKGG